MRPLLLLLLLFISAVDAATTTAPMVSVCQVCASTGRCLNAGPNGDAGKYCGILLDKVALTSQACCCSVAQICPTPSQGAVCDCAGVKTAPPEKASYNYTWVIIVASTVGPFVLYGLCCCGVGCIDGCNDCCAERRQRKAAKQRERAKRQRERDEQAAQERVEAAMPQAVIVSEIPAPTAMYVAQATPVYAGTLK
ncbi:hypothetical protein SPRG_09833 [Saprolegnia parasitica CBS 223.65]|uniref:Uncharacterized protein n=1 Tax=Saprolegnia parasitica (strain CBS 223.65) TaxID=695850 RepID=A0A067C1M8_SAPPC|nr:hypothetical protein SPRG_09833 [Saprolegnia parasitica CBS 223.65]KDO24443.1 hypothetical protein SPRG_09833 [Saprolegnia parasitica CBS 223.65]|eukprot:XP_012204873.1 hypothetical protein SPRG_09833 [Saprolegnia parasitica CBS 223.65]